MAGITRLIDEIFTPKIAMQFFYQDDTGVSRSAFELDCIPTENFSGTTEYTKNPIQKGSDITDHAKHSPITLSITFIVSNYPIRIEEVPFSIGAGIIGGLSNSIVAKIAVSEAIIKLREEMDPEGFLRSKLAFEKIEEIRLKSVPLQIYSERKEYQNMVITSFTVTDSKDTQHSLVGSISFEEISTVDISKSTVSVPSKSIDESVRAGAVEKSKIGKKPPETTDTATTKKAKSWILQLI